MHLNSVYDSTAAVLHASQRGGQVVRALLLLVIDVSVGCHHISIPLSVDTYKSIALLFFFTSIINFSLF